MISRNSKVTPSRVYIENILLNQLGAHKQDTGMTHSETINEALSLYFNTHNDTASSDTEGYEPEHHKPK